MATLNAASPSTNQAPNGKPEQIRVSRRSRAYWRVTIDNPPINVMGPEMVREFQQLIDAIEADEQVRSWSSIARWSTISYSLHIIPPKRPF